MSRRQFRPPPRSSDGPPDDTGCTVLHVDMDAFYASASLIDRPELRGTPVIIGGGGRSVVLSATYEARAFGVTSAMPMTRARRLCPQATVISPDHDRYAAISDAVMATFASVTDRVEPLSLDEAFLDIAGAVRRLGPPTTIAQWLRDTIADEQGITCSVGVASTKFVAKLASGLAKPDGLIVVPQTEVIAFLHQLPVGALWGVGDRTEEALQRLGLHTVADLAHTPLDTLRRALGDATGAQLHDLAWGRDARRVVPQQREKSIGSDETFAADIDDPTLIHPESAPPGSSGAPSPSKCASPTSRRSPAVAPCATPLTCPARSMPPRRPSSTRSGCSGPGSGWSACGWRGWSRPSARPSSPVWTIPTTAGATPIGRSTEPARGSGRERSVPRPWSEASRSPTRRVCRVPRWAPRRAADGDPGSPRQARVGEAARRSQTVRLPQPRIGTYPDLLARNTGQVGDVDGLGPVSGQKSKQALGGVGRGAVGAGAEAP